eukprot:9501206-Pyramimonas_sp.AAC.1
MRCKQRRAIYAAPVYAAQLTLISSRSLRETAWGPCPALARRRPLGDLQGHTANVLLMYAERLRKKDGP